MIDRYRTDIIATLRDALGDRRDPPYAQMRYHLGWQDGEGQIAEGRGGKLLRPALCLLCCEAVGGDWRRALPAAAAIELLHNFTLIHDDVQDASDQRHGRDTVWRLWGASEAINAGDGMFALAHITLLSLQDQGFAPDRVLSAASILDETTLRLCEGQHIDITAQGEASLQAYLTMIGGKTAALIAASAQIGALLGDGPPAVVDALREFGRRLGLAFQIQDDVLGIWGEMAVTGKPTGDDLRAGKRSYPIIYGLTQASSDDRRELELLLERGELTEDQIAHACLLLDKIGAREHSERTAREHAEAAISSLHDISLKPEHLEQLTNLALFSANRRS